MKIIYVNPAAALGGAELSLLDLMSSTRAALPGAELHLIAMAPGPMVEVARGLGVRVHVRGMPGSIAGLGDSSLRGRGRLAATMGMFARALGASLAARRYARDLRGLIRELDPDLVHSNGIKSHLLLRPARPSGVSVVWHIRDFYGARPVVARALRWASRGAVGGIAISEAVGRDARIALGDGFPIEVVHNGIETERFAPGAGSGDRLDGLAGLPPVEPGTIRVGLLATYARWKGQDVFLKALARLDPGLRPPVRGYLIGGPIYETRGSQFSEAELRSVADALGLGTRVGFVPFQDETADIYRALDVVVHASILPEPFGRTIVEAMACGRPTIIARAGGAAELFVEGRDAIGVQPGDPDSLCAAIRRLVDDPGLRRAIAGRARRTAVDRFDRRRLGPEVLSAYGRLGLP